MSVVTTSPDHAPAGQDCAPAAALRSRRGLDPLTDRKCEVLVLAAEGQRNREIVAFLVVSEAHLERHINRIM